MKVAYLQHDCAYLEPETNRHHVRQLLENAAPEIDLLILPELFTSGYYFKSKQDAEQSSEPIPSGATTEWLTDIASKLNCSIVAGLAEKTPEALYNSALVVSPGGHEYTYRKSHLYFEEKENFSTGDSGLNVIDLETAEGEPYRLGVMVCYDWFYPEAARTLALRGADIIAHPSNLVRPNCPRAMPIRALENRVFTITANRIGSETKDGDTLTFIGQSQVCSPTGETLAKADRTSETLDVVDINPLDARDKNITEHNPLFDDRRTDLYELN